MGWYTRGGDELLLIWPFQRKTCFGRLDLQWKHISLSFHNTLRPFSFSLSSKTINSILALDFSKLSTLIALSMWFFGCWDVNFKSKVIHSFRGSKTHRAFDVQSAPINKRQRDHGTPGNWPNSSSLGFNNCLFSSSPSYLPNLSTSPLHCRFSCGFLLAVPWESLCSPERFVSLLQLFSTIVLIDVWCSGGSFEGLDDIGHFICCYCCRCPWNYSWCYSFYHSGPSQWVWTTLHCLKYFFLFIFMNVHNIHH